MIIPESNGVEPEETLAIGISFGNSNSGIAYTTSVGKSMEFMGKPCSNSNAGRES